VTKKHWTLGRLHTFLGTSSRIGLELMLDLSDGSITIHLLNVWVVFEWWPKDTDSFWY
jgi:hypothetical protein